MRVNPSSYAISSVPLIAQDHYDDQSYLSAATNAMHDQHYVHHREWKKGHRIGHDDWNRGAQVDWHSHHLRRPPRGYEWREVDGNYVLAAVATGIIASVIIASHAH